MKHGFPAREHRGESLQGPRRNADAGSARHDDGPGAAHVAARSGGDDPEGTADSVERLMGTKPEARFAFIRSGGRARGNCGRLRALQPPLNHDGLP